MRITFIRHGQPAWIVDGHQDTDPALTPLGHVQAQALGEHLRGRTFDALWVSDAVRAQQTAAPIAEALGLPIDTRPWLHEVKTHALHGWPEAEVRAFFHGRRNAPPSAWWEGLPDCESVRDFVSRISDGLDDALAELGGRKERQDGVHLWQELPDLHVAVVSHAGTSGAALAHLLDMEHVPWPWERLQLAHTGLAEVHTTPLAGGAIFALGQFGTLPHLKADQHTR